MAAGFPTGFTQDHCTDADTDAVQGVPRHRPASCTRRAQRADCHAHAEDTRSHQLATPHASHCCLFLQQDVALAVRPSRQSWSCIVFATRKLATLAVEAVLRAAPSLSFLMSTPFMGYGGDTSAASMDVKVGQQQRLAISLLFEPRATALWAHVH